MIELVAAGVRNELGQHRRRQFARRGESDAGHLGPLATAAAQCHHPGDVSNRKGVPLLPDHLDRLTTQQLGEHLIGARFGKGNLKVDPGGAVAHVELGHGRAQPAGLDGDCARRCGCRTGLGTTDRPHHDTDDNDDGHGR